MRKRGSVADCPLCLDWKEWRKQCGGNVVVEASMLEAVVDEFIRDYEGHTPLERGEFISKMISRTPYYTHTNERKRKCLDKKVK